MDSRLLTDCISVILYTQAERDNVKLEVRELIVSTYMKHIQKTISYHLTRTDKACSLAYDRRSGKASLPGTGDLAQLLTVYC